MKKIALLTSLFLTLSSYCLEQQEDPVASIVNEIRQDVATANSRSPEWDLETFLRSQKAAELKKKIQPLSRADKNRLIGEVINISPIYLKWPVTRDFWALAVESGGNIDTIHQYLFSGQLMTFLEESALENDVAAVIFALNHNANTALKSSEYPLALTENYDIAQLLIDKGALEPFQNDPKEAFKLLRNALNFALSYRLLKLYSEKGLNLKLKNSDNDTLLHWLYGSFNLKYNKPYNFFEKFKTLYKAGAVDLNAKNKFKKTPLDLLNDVKETDQDNATVKLARALLEGLEKTPAERRKKLELLQQNPPENPVGLQELLYPMKNPRIFQSTQLSEKE